ncbi:MAG: hypothetical protein WD490_03465 [Opitutales bacterium]
MNIYSAHSLHALLSLITLSLLHFSFAPVANGGDISILTPSPQGFTVSTGASFAFPADLERADPGDVSIARYRARASYNFPSDPGEFLSLTGIFEHTDYDWSDAGLFGNTNRLSLSAIGLRQVGESRWGVFGLGQVSWAAESGAPLRRGFSSTWVFGPSYRITRDLAVTVGGLVNTQPERGTRVIPVAGLNWRISEQWSLRTLNGALLTYAPDPRFQMNLFGEYRTRGIRLQRQLLPGGSTSRPAVGEREIAVGFGAAWRATENLTLRGSAEYLFAREWRFRADGSRFRTVEAESTPQVALRLAYDF